MARRFITSWLFFQLRCRAALCPGFGAALYHSAGEKEKKKKGEGKKGKEKGKGKRE